MNFLRHFPADAFLAGMGIYDRVREAIESAGARLRYLPPYSPDFNPIENMWSKIKQRLRSLAPRTGEELLLASAHAFAAHLRRRLPDSALI